MGSRGTSQELEDARWCRALFNQVSLYARDRSPSHHAQALRAAALTPPAMTRSGAPERGGARFFTELENVHASVCLQRAGSRATCGAMPFVCSGCPPRSRSSFWVRRPSWVAAALLPASRMGSRLSCMFPHVLRGPFVGRHIAAKRALDRHGMECRRRGNDAQRRPARRLGTIHIIIALRLW